MSTLRLHNTLAGTEEVFRPLEPGRVSFYTCGPTVYDFTHIGNFRSFLAADLLRRWLESPLCQQADPSGEPVDAWGYDVTHVMNITDVGHMTDDDTADGGGEDKMDAARKRLLEDKKSGRLPEGAATSLDPNDPWDIAGFYADAFMEDGRTLGVRVVEEAGEDASLMPRPTQRIRAMLEMIHRLLDSGHAYIASDGVAYFDTQSFPPYGRLSGNTPDAIRSGAGGRVDESVQAIKRHPADFMLWKPDPTHRMRWNPSDELGKDSPLGEGYPGWHLECSAMALERLGARIDLHSGGEDNIFPHHECEIAQSCCANSTDIFSRFWFHPRFLQVEGKKMSKSLGNFFTVRDLTSRGFSPAAIRLELIRMHYRSNANFTEQGLRDAQRNIDRWRAFRERGRASREAGERDVEAVRAFTDAMNDDLNIGGALGSLNSWMNRTPDPSQADAEFMDVLEGVLGVLDLADVEVSGSAEGGDEDARIDDLVRRRTEARASKDWPEADRIRDELNALNVVVEDTPEGPKWSRRASLS